MTKAVTSLAVMMLFEEGHFLLDDPISRYIPALASPQVLAQDLGELETVPARREITIQQLLTHTSGISYRFVAAPGPTETIAQLYRDVGISDGLSQTPGRIADLSEKLGGLPILFEPGTQYSYSLSVDVLGHLVEIVSESTLDEFFAARIFEPLGMIDTHFFLDDGDVERLASIYTPRDDAGIRELGEDPIDEGYLVYSSSYPYSGPRTYFSGGGGLTSTASDYARFLQMFLNGGELDGIRLLGPKTVEMMTRNSIGDISVSPGIKFGLGFAVVEDPGLAGDVRSAGSYFWGGFFNTRYFVDPSEELIGIFMSQLYPQGPQRIRDRFNNVVYQAIVD
jgi:CubicO group peptidase (beta-lactamase class C family)